MSGNLICLLRKCEKDSPSRPDREGLGKLTLTQAPQIHHLTPDGGKAMNVYEVITARIMEQLEQGTIPWQKPWNHTAGLPRNLLSQKEYRGINVWLLASGGYSSPFWLTYKQAGEIGGYVREGEHGSPVVFWKGLKREEENQDGGEIGSNTKRVPVARRRSGQ